MIEKVYGILQEYEEYISNAKDQKKTLKKKRISLLMNIINMMQSGIKNSVSMRYTN